MCPGKRAATSEPGSEDLIDVSEQAIHRRLPQLAHTVDVRPDPIPYSARSNFPDRAELALPTPSEVSQRFLNGDLRLSAP
jgi:hypothetical protein